MYTLAMGYDNMHRIKSKSQHLTQDNVQFNGTLNAGYDLSYTYGTDTGKKFQLANVKDVNYRTEETPSESENVNNNHAYEYDANGNLVYVNTSRTKKDGVADEKTAERKLKWDEENRLLASDDNGFVTNYWYDANGNLVYVNTSRTKKDGMTDEKAAERKLKWDEENRLLASDDNGFVTNYWYDADGERTVKTSGESDQVYVNSEFAGGRTNTAKFSLYVSPYLVANQGGRYTKHIYIGSLRVVSKIGDFDSYGSDPRRIQYAGSETDGLSVDYKVKAIKDNYATFAVPYNGEDNNDYVDGKGFCCNDGSFEAAQARALARAAKNNFQEGDTYEKMQFYYHPDHLGSSSYITNLDGEVVQHIEYVPFGEVFIEERNNVWNTPYLFNAKEFDEETGMYYYGARYYEPRLSLWMSTDGQQEEYPNISSYTYSASSPVNYVDPDGNLVIFVNGYYNTRSGLITRYITEYITGNKGGKSYWGVDFVNKATSYLNDNNIQFVDGRGKYNSSGDDRFNAGYKFAQSNYANISSTLKDGETVKVVSHSMGAAYSEGIIKYLLEQGISISQVIHFSPADPDDFSASFSNTLQLNINNDAVLAYKIGFSSNIINGVAKYGNVKTDNSFFYDLIHSHAQTKLKGDVWGYIKALNSIHMEYIGTKTDYIYHGSSLAPSYTPVTRNLYKGVNNNGVIFKSLQINGQIYKNNSGNTYTNP